MSIASYFTLVWFLLAMFTLGITKYYKISLPKIKDQKQNILLLVLEAVAISISFYSNNGHNSSRYIVVIALILILVGWVKSHQNLLLRIFRGVKGRPLFWRINLIVDGNRHPQNPYFLGDWYQIIAIGLLWNSLFSLAISCGVYPIAIYIFSVAKTRNFADKLKDKSEFTRNEIWENFIKTTFSSVVRNIVFILLLIIPIAVTNRDLIIFWGIFQDAINLITTLAQVEATVFALVITFLFVLVEFTNSAYSPRLVRSFTHQQSFRLMVLFAFISISTKFWLMANAPRYINLPTEPSDNVIVDWALLLTSFSVLSYFIFIRDIINLMQPEAIAKQILIKFDQGWIDIVRKDWKEPDRIERLILSDEDPMILFERYLATTIERGDIYSIRVALMLMRDRLRQFMNQDDGAIIDVYLFNRIGNIVDILSEKHLDLALEIFCNVVNEVTTPSIEVLKKSESGMFDAPLGARILRRVAEKAVDRQLLDSGSRAINYLERRCETAIKVLPPYSDLWLLNPANLENKQFDNEKSRKNDRQVESVEFGYFQFFKDLGIKAIKGKNRDLAWSASHALAYQILHIIDSVTEEPYQRYLILNCLWRLEELVKTSCEENFPGVIDFGMLSFGVEKISYESTAIIIATEFAKVVDLMTKAEILDSNHVRDISVMGFYLSQKYPQTTIPILNSLGAAAERYKKAKSDTRQEKLDFILNEILGRIDQVEKAGRSHAQGEIKSKISVAAKKARSKINSNTANRSRGTAKK